MIKGPVVPHPHLSSFSDLDSSYRLIIVRHAFPGLSVLSVVFVSKLAFAQKPGPADPTLLVDKHCLPVWNCEPFWTFNSLSRLLIPFS